MTTDKNTPFSDVLESLFEDASLPIQLLYRLSDMTAEQITQFVERWPDVGEERRRVIVRHLADLSETNFIVDFLPVFAHCIQHDPAPSVRIAALDGVWDATGTGLIDPIIRLLQQDGDVDVRAAAAAALAHYVLFAEWGQLPQWVLSRVVTALLAELDDLNAPVPVRRAVLEAVASASHPRIPALIESAYEDIDLGMQLSAVFAMGSSADSRWLPILMDEMESEMGEMRAEAARAAGAIGDEQALPQLAELVGDEDTDVALAAVTALGQLGGERAYELLAQFAEDPELELLHDAVDEALEEIGWLQGELTILAIPDADGPEED
ncbi:MAG: HEAT repeat domain-containing protein [Anaerolineae bacterium]